MLRIPQINSANNRESAVWCAHCVELHRFATTRGPGDRTGSHPWDGSLALVLRSWETTLRAALLLAIALAGAVAVVLALSMAGAGTVFDLLSYIVLRGRI